MGSRSYPGAIRLTTFASADRWVKPSTVSLSANRLKIRGGSGLFTGVTGTASQDLALHAAGAAFLQAGQSFLILHAYFKFDGYKFSAARDDENSIQQASLVDFSRMKSSLLKILHGKLLNMLSPDARQKFSSGHKAISSLIASHPYLIEAMFDMYPSLQAILHPAVMDYTSDPLTNRARVKVMTVRNINSLVGAEVLHNPAIQVSLH